MPECIDSVYAGRGHEPVSLNVFAYDRRSSLVYSGQLGKVTLLIGWRGT